MKCDKIDYLGENRLASAHGWRRNRRVGGDPVEGRVGAMCNHYQIHEKRSQHDKSVFCGQLRSKKCDRVANNAGEDVVVTHPPSSGLPSLQPIFHRGA